jgi:hypothetical protein
MNKISGRGSGGVLAMSQVSTKARLLLPEKLNYKLILHHDNEAKSMPNVGITGRLPERYKYVTSGRRMHSSSTVPQFGQNDTAGGYRPSEEVITIVWTHT